MIYSKKKLTFANSTREHFTQNVQVNRTIQLYKSI